MERCVLVMESVTTANGQNYPKLSELQLWTVSYFVSQSSQNYEKAIFSDSQESITDIFEIPELHLNLF